MDKLDDATATEEIDRSAPDRLTIEHELEFALIAAHITHQINIVGG